MNNSPASDLQLIDDELLERVSRAASDSPRRRKNYNFHSSDDAASHRLLNAIEPGSYIQPHCHSDPAKDETIIALRGRLGVVFFDANGTVTSTVELVPGGPTSGVNIPHGVFHSLVALAPGSVFFESKAGPYRPLTASEKADWAPAEGSSAASEFLSHLRHSFAD